MNLPQHDGYDIRITEISVMPKGQPLFSELTTHIRIEDEAAGEYVKVSDTPESAERRREDFISVIVDACKKYGVMITEDIQENGEERQVFQEFRKDYQWGFIVSIDALERYVREAVWKEGMT